MEKKSKIFSRIIDALKNLLLFVKEINILSQNTMSNLKKLTLEMDIWLILNIESNIKSLIHKNKDKLFFWKIHKLKDLRHLKDSMQLHFNFKVNKVYKIQTIFKKIIVKNNLDII